MHRIYTTLDTHAFAHLQRLAQEQKKTISQIVRDAVLHYLQTHQPQDAQDFDAVLEKLRQIRQRNAEKYGPWISVRNDMHLRRRLILKRLIILRRIARRLWAYRRRSRYNPRLHR